MRATRVLVVVVALLAACSDGGDDDTAPTTTAVARTTAELVPSVCPFDPPPTDHWECTTMIVPADRSHPEKGHVLLPVAVLRSQSAARADDPIVYFEGGPGGDTLTSVAGFFGELERGGTRDVIIFDQRGTGGARPSLNCPELEQAQRDDLASTDDAADTRRGKDATRACRARLVDAGVDLDLFDTSTTAEDAEDLRRALGVQQWNVMGVSYGTTVALEVARQHPETVRSLMIDSVFTPDITQDGVRVLRAADRAFRVFFAGCAKSPACAASHPDLHAEFNALAKSWDDQPFELDVDDPRDNDEKLHVRLTGSDLAQGLHQALYRADLIPILPQVSAQIRRRDDAARALVATFVLDGLTQSLHNAEGLEGVVNCADRQRLDPTGVDIDVDTILAATPSARVIGESYRDCDIWKVASAPAAFNTIPRSSLPTLALAGEYDPITPPEDTERVAKRFAGSTFVLFPGLGHGEIFSHDCPRSILKEFLDDPTVPPDLTCVKAMGPPAFTPG